MRKKDREKLNQVSQLVTELELEWKKVDKEQSDMDVKRYKAWEDMMRPYHNKKWEIVNKLKSLEKEKERLELIENHHHDWQYKGNYDQYGLNIEVFNCNVCGKFKKKKKFK